jgi:hypothetical protein
VKYLSLYLLFGAIVAVWSAINYKDDPGASPDPELSPRARMTSMLAAYVLVALVWPFSIALFVYSLVLGFLARRRPEERER